MPETIAHLTRRLVEFREERDWAQFHSLKNLLMSLTIESAELLELAQWKEDGALEADLHRPEVKARLEEEVADVFLYLLLVCERAGIDLARAAERKIDLNAAKYPAHKARGSARKYTEL
ncbi:MAG: nucleotide pyrophosphohydrolase [Magnetospirillum sp. WYHS-4]